MGQKSILSSIVVVGRMGSPHGVKGWAHIQSFTEPTGNLLGYKTWYLKLSGKWCVVIQEARLQGGSIVARLQGYDSREAVAKLVNTEIGVDKSEFPRLVAGEYYWSELIGLKVLTTTDVLLGTVESLLETGSNDVLVVQGDKKQHLIPYIPDEYVLRVDLTAGIIEVAWDPEF
jgi:16S rRNA processing protein RimM